MIQIRGGLGLRNDLPGDFLDGKFLRITKIARPGDLGRAFHQQFEAPDQVVYEAEATSLTAGAINGNRSAAQRLHDKIRHHPTIILQHTRAVGVEDPRNFDFKRVNAMIVEKQGFRGALPFVITGSWTDWIDVADIAFRLRMNFRITIDFAGRCLKYPARFEHGEFKYVVGADHAGLHRANRVALVMTRRGRTR